MHDFILGKCINHNYLRVPVVFQVMDSAGILSEPPAQLNPHDIRRNKLLVFLLRFDFHRCCNPCYEGDLSGGLFVVPLERLL